MKELFPLKIIAIIFLSWKKNAIYNCLVLLKVKKKTRPRYVCRNYVQKTINLMLYEYIFLEPLIPSSTTLQELNQFFIFLEFHLTQMLLEML